MMQKTQQTNHFVAFIESAKPETKGLNEHQGGQALYIKLHFGERKQW
jgi:hypothetical protein